MSKYIKHLIMNWNVPFHALTDFFAHLVHGLFPFIKIKHHQPVKEDSYNKAIDYYMKKLCNHCIHQENECNRMECPFCTYDACYIVKIAEQLKGGGQNE